MSFEIMFLIGCLSVLGLFVVALTISTIIMGSRFGLRMQHMFNSLKYDKEVDDMLNRLIAKVEAGLMIAKLHDKTIKFYTPETYNEAQNLSSWERRNTEEAEVWIGNKFTQYGYLVKYFTLGKYELENKCGSYRTFRRLLALEDALSGRTVVKVQEEPKEKPSKESVELE